jgi:hypothetical protein
MKFIQQSTKVHTATIAKLRWKKSQIPTDIHCVVFVHVDLAE